MPSKSKLNTSDKESDVLEKKHKNKRKDDRKATKRKDTVTKRSTISTSKQPSSPVLSPTLNTNQVEDAYVKVLKELDGSSRKKHPLSNDDIHALSKLLSAGELYKICLIKILINNKAANSHGMNESQFFKKIFDIDKSVLSRIKNCIRVLSKLFGDDYSTYPLVSRDTLLTLYKISKLSKKAEYELDLMEIWNEALSISEANNRKKVFSRDVQEAALDILPSKVFDQIDMSNIKIEKIDITERDEDEEVPLITINLDLDRNSFCLDDAKEQVIKCTSMQSMNKALHDVYQASDDYLAKLDESDPLNPYNKLLAEQEEEFEELFKRYKRDQEELIMDVATYLEDLQKLYDIIADNVKSLKRQFLKP